MFRRFRELFAIRGVFTPRNVVVMGIMLAMSVVLGQFSIFITPQFKFLGFDYLPGAMVGILFGPWAALLYGFASDTLGFFLRPQGPYFIGYALSAMASYGLYAIVMYRRPITFWRAAIARALILAIVVFGLNYLWNYMMYGQVAAKYFTTTRIINNLAQFPLHVFLTGFLARCMVGIRPIRRALRLEGAVVAARRRSSVPPA